MTAVSIKNIDEALALKYSGLSIDIGDPPVSTPVTVFVEEPSSEEYKERVYPSIAIKFLSLSENSPSRHSDDEQEEEYDYDDTVTPPIRTMRKRGDRYEISYTIDTWHKIRAGESRDLLRYAIIETTPTRGYITVTDIDGGSQDLWVFWNGTLTTLDEQLNDVVIYHKTLTVRILAKLLPDKTLREYKTATKLTWKFSNNDDPPVDHSIMDITDSGVEAGS